MSYAQWLEEQQYDTQTEYLNVLRQEHEDPYQFIMDCEEHGQSFDVRSGHCTECPVFVPKTPEEILLESLDDYEVPF
jgi:nitrite reductase/ring-hydroxylating ferredoxin subunit